MLVISIGLPLRAHPILKLLTPLLRELYDPRSDVFWLISTKLWKLAFQIRMPGAFSPTRLKKKKLWKRKMEKTKKKRKRSYHVQLIRTLITSALDTGIQLNGKQTENRAESQEYNQRQWKLKPYRLTIMTMPKHSHTRHGNVCWLCFLANTLLP